MFRWQNARTDIPVWKDILKVNQLQARENWIELKKNHTLRGFMNIKWHYTPKNNE